MRSILVCDLCLIFLVMMFRLSVDVMIKMVSMSVWVCGNVLMLWMNDWLILRMLMGRCCRYLIEEKFMLKSSIVSCVLVVVRWCRVWVVCGLFCIRMVLVIFSISWDLLNDEMVRFTCWMKFGLCSWCVDMLIVRLIGCFVAVMSRGVLVIIWVSMC